MIEEGKGLVNPNTTAQTDNIYSTYKDINVSIIENVFKDYIDYKMWVICNSQKVPIDPKTTYPLKWSNTDLYMTFDELQKWLKIYDNFGLFTGIQKFDINNKPYPSVRCLDFDHVLVNGEPQNPKLLKLLDRLNTFVEISSSGNGLHAFIISEADVSEFGFDSDNYWDGKYYPQNHFIKCTGNVYKNYNLPLVYLDKSDLLNLKKNIGKINIEMIPNDNLNKSYNINKTWVQILKEVGIEFYNADYVGKQSPKSGKICMESLKIECPNKENHTTDRKGDKSAHLAILQRWGDGSSSIKCVHNSCKPENHPNLLQKLWNKINDKKVDSILIKMGWI